MWITDCFAKNSCLFRYSDTPDCMRSTPGRSSPLFALHSSLSAQSHRQRALSKQARHWCHVETPSMDVPMHFQLKPATHTHHKILITLRYKLTICGRINGTGQSLIQNYIIGYHSPKFKVIECQTTETCALFISGWRNAAEVCAQLEIEDSVRTSISHRGESSIPVILRLGSNVSIFSTRSRASEGTWGNFSVNDCRLYGGSCLMYFFPFSCRDSRSVSEGEPISWKARKFQINAGTWYRIHGSAIHQMNH